MSNENHIPEEAAKAQVDILIEYYDIDREKELPKSAIPDLERHIMRGRVTIELVDDELKVYQNFKKPINETTGLEYKEISGMNKKQMKSAAKSHIEQVHSLMASLSGGGADKIARLSGVDMSAMEALGNLFLSV